MVSTKSVDVGNMSSTGQLETEKKDSREPNERLHSVVGRKRNGEGKGKGKGGRRRNRCRRGSTSLRRLFPEFADIKGLCQKILLCNCSPNGTNSRNILENGKWRSFANSQESILYRADKGNVGGISKREERVVVDFKLWTVECKLIAGCGQ